MFAWLIVNTYFGTTTFALFFGSTNQCKKIKFSMDFIFVINLQKTWPPFYCPENIYRLNWFYHFLTGLYSTHFYSVRQHHIAQNFPRKNSRFTKFSCLCGVWQKFYFMNTKMQYLSPDTSRSLPSFCFGFIALVPNSHKSWSFPTRAKLAKLSHSLNRLPRKDTAFSLFTLWNYSPDFWFSIIIKLCICWSIICLYMKQKEYYSTTSCAYMAHGKVV